MAELSAMQALMDSASNLADEIRLKEEDAAEAILELEKAKEKAKNAWNEVYISLLTLMNDHYHDDSFKSSKPGYMLLEESEKGRAKR